MWKAGPHEAVGLSIVSVQEGAPDLTQQVPGAEALLAYGQDRSLQWAL